MFAKQTSSQNHFNPISSDGFSHFHFFCMSNSGEPMIRQFVENSQPFDINHATNPFCDTYPGYTSLHFAIRYKALLVANTLMTLGADVNVENADGNTPLHLAILQKLITTRRDIFISLMRHGANFNTKNLRGQTAADLLMTMKKFTFEQLQFLLSNGSSINIRVNSSLPGPHVLIMQNADEEDVMKIFKTFINRCDLADVLSNGYTLISEVATASLAVEECMEIIDQLVNVGCDIYQPYEKADLELQQNIIQDNGVAVRIWLLLGANVNACNLANLNFDPVTMSMIEIFMARHIYKMKILGFYVKTACNSLYYNFQKKFPVDASVQLEINIELVKAESVQVTEKLTARAFLSESWGTIYYSKLPISQREDVDAFFRRILPLYEQFPSVCGIMILQYRKALVRSKLLEPAKEVLANECNMDFPDPCLDCLLNYFSNDELVYLIENSEDTANPCKRARIE